MDSLFNESVVVRENLGEDLEGNQTTRSTSRDAYVESVEGGTRSDTGVTRAREYLVAIKPVGYGTVWSVKEADKVLWRGREMSVREVREVRIPQTTALHHIEVRCG